MGLDMYLRAKINVQPYAYASEAVRNPKFNNILEIVEVEEESISSYMGIVVDVPVGYWRKANAIHGWFIKESGKEDDCSPLYFSSTQLNDLRKVCLEVMDKKDEDFAMENLPPTEGFFFGSYGVDAYYYEDVENTIDILNKALDVNNVAYYEYCASW
jgi:hypothetical protein